jgi:hypothetical protein
VTTPKYTKDPLADAKKAFRMRKWRAKQWVRVILFFAVVFGALAIITYTQ